MESSIVGTRVSHLVRIYKVVDRDWLFSRESNETVVTALWASTYFTYYRRASKSKDSCQQTLT
jgi:hypothetical protein